MLLLVVLFSILFLYILYKRDIQSSFSKAKVIPLKSILSICIVLHHLSFFVINPFLDQFHGWGKIIVSVFFFVSGYGLMKSWQNKGNAYLNNFLRRRIYNALLIPFIISTFLFVIINNISITPSILFNNLITKGDTLLPNAWFVYAMLILYLSFIIGCKVRQGKFLIPITYLICFVLVLYCTINNFGDWVFISIFSFPFGISYAVNESKIILAFNKRLGKFLVYDLIIPILLTLSLFLYKINFILTDLFIYPILSVVVIIICSILRLQNLSKYRIIVFVSSISYEIYLSHGLVMFFLRRTYLAVNHNFTFILTTILLSLLLSYLIKRLQKIIIRE